MLSTKQSTSTFLSDLLTKYNWVSTSSDSPKLVALVTTNAVPITFQATQLKGSINDLDTPIIEIWSEIDLLQNMTASLEARMIQFKDIRHDYCAALSPICHLSSKILAEILHCTPKEQM
ncbi:hypothetical protein IW262DRAFT_1469535 [Armillaria fumosa]|nr:hypothetical protein IW262DRAFT_1469535 [Armillaria fumosa]